MKNTKAVLLDRIRQNCGEKGKVALDAKFLDIALDSLGFVAVLVGLEDSLSVEFEDDELSLYRYETVSDLYKLIEAKRRRRK